MNAAALSELKTTPSFTELVKSLPPFSLNSLVCKSRKIVPVSDRPVVIVDDSPTCRELCRRFVLQVDPHAVVECCDSLMDAARYLGNARLVILDWHLKGMTAEEPGVFAMLKKCHIPHFVWTSSETVTGLDCPVVVKGNTRKFRELAEELLAGKSASVSG